MPTRTLAEMRDSVWAALDGNSTFYPATEVDAAINEQIRVANLVLGFYQDSVEINTVANQYIYELPAPMLVPLAVSLAQRQLSRSSLAALAKRRRSWMQETTANYGPVSTWMPIGVRYLAIHPADAAGGRTLLVEGICDPPKATLDNDVLQIPGELTDAIRAMAAHVLQLKEGGKIFADSAAAYQEFLHQSKLLSIWRDWKRPRFYLEQQQPSEGG